MIRGTSFGARFVPNDMKVGNMGKVVTSYLYILGKSCTLEVVCLIIIRNLYPFGLNFMCIITYCFLCMLKNGRNRLEATSAMMGPYNNSENKKNNYKIYNEIMGG